jgi:serine/threonine protein kinase
MVPTSTTGFPRSFGKYELLERVGDGGMAEVFRARLPGVAGFEKIVVIKKILPHLAKKKRFVDMFVAEAKLAAEVQHKNVVQVFELGQIQESGEFYMAMEYVQGTDLRHVLGFTTKRNLRLPPWFSVYSVSEILEGLHFAHMLTDQSGRPRNIVHRDVTPSNIFISSKGEIKLGDFGVARDDARDSKTKTGQLKGKIGYMSPEQVRSLAVDGRTDVFALGIVLWECLAQRRLFKGRSDFEAMSLICTAPREPPSRYAPDVPPALDQIVLQALEPNLEHRIQTAREMQARLLTVLPMLKQTARPSDVEELIRALAKNPGEPGAILQPMRRVAVAPVSSAPEDQLEFEDSDPSIEAPAIPTAPQSSFGSSLPPFPGPSTSSSSHPGVPVAPMTTAEQPSRLPPPRQGSTTSGAGATGDVPVIVGSPEPRRRGPSTQIINAAVEDAARVPLESVKDVPLSAFGTVPPPSAQTDPNALRAGFEIRVHGSEVSDAEKLRWASYGLVGRAYDGEQPYWIQNHEGYTFGPVSYEEALTVVKAESLAHFADKARISGDRTNWIDLQQFAILTGQPILLRSGEERIPAKATFHGALNKRSMTSVFGALAMRNATGRLFVSDTAHQSRASRELDIIAGRPTDVYAHSDALQLPALLVQKKYVPASMMRELIHASVVQLRPLELIAGEKVGMDFSQYQTVFMKDRLVDIFDWPSGKFAFDDSIKPEPKVPFARSLSVLVLEMVGRKLNVAALRHYLQDVMNAKLKPSEQFEQRLPEFGLPPALLDTVQKLAKGKKLSALIKPAEEKQILSVIYVLMEMELLRAPR